MYLKIQLQLKLCFSMKNILAFCTVSSPLAFFQMRILQRKWYIFFFSAASDAWKHDNSKMVSVTF